MVIECCMWAAHALYLFGLFPQVVINYRCKSGTGVSDLFLLGYLNASFFGLVYIFCLDVHFIYKLMVPFQALTMCIVAGQRLYYEAYPRKTKFLWLYGLNIVGMILLLPTAYNNPLWMGHLAGWISFVLYSTNQLPQVFKIQRQKSVKGFSFLFVFLSGIGAVFEIIGAFLAHLPLQTCFNALRGLILCIIFCIQFMMFRDKDARA